MLNTDRNSLLSWYRENRRDLPWRRTRDPYLIWVSEIMCQQTQVATVLPYFKRWIERFPTIQSLALATESDVLPLWQGLGYYQRCRSMLECARHIEVHGWPATADELKKLPGVGAYTAGEIAAICFNEPSAAVDGNVQRVYSRLQLDHASGPALNRNAWRWAADVVDSESPGDWNQALMELGAFICRPKNPICECCPLATACEARKAGIQQALPTKRQKPAATPVQTDACVAIADGLLGVEQIGAGEWAQGLWRFPTLVPDDAKEVGEVRHVVTRHQVTMKVHITKKRHPHLRYVSREELQQLGMPSPQWKALKIAEAKIAQLIGITELSGGQGETRTLTP